MMTHLQFIENKIVNREVLSRKLHVDRLHSRKVVFTNGCFDIIHKGHVDYLSKAADLGDILVIGLNTDSSIRRIKGDSRPIIDQDSRALLLAALQFVNYICFFDEDTPYDLIKVVQPDILVKGADYSPENIVGYDIVKARGGRVDTIHFVPGFSTSSIIDKIRNTQ